MNERLVLLTAEQREVTGGHLFDRRVLERAPANGASADVLTLRSLSLPAQVAEARRAIVSLPAGIDVLLIDSLVASAAALALPGRRAYRTAGLVHQRLGGYSGSARQRFSAALDRRLYRRLELLVTTSAWLGDPLRTLAVPVAVVTPGRDLPSNAAARVDLRRGRSSAILSVANWLPHKGTLDLVEAVARLPDDAATLHLVGATYPESAYGARVRARVARDDLQGRVVVHGALRNEDLATLYESADLFALPSVGEVYGIAVAEALGRGLPVVAYRSGNVPYLVSDGREGLLSRPGDVEGLAWRLCVLALDPDRRAELAACARARAASLPTWDEAARAFFSAVRGGMRLAPSRAA